MRYGAPGQWGRRAYLKPWRVFLCRETLKKVIMTSQPPVLHFHVGESGHHTLLRILIPHGCEEEAASLMERFQAEMARVREAQMQARQRLMYPPEPE